MDKAKSLIWVLADDRPGNYAQAIGLAAALDRAYEVKKIIYNYFAKLPNFLKIKDFIGITAWTKSQLLGQLNPPQIIIAAGRKAALVSLFLKRHYPNVFIIQIMKPDVSLAKFAKFNLVILPQHDNFIKKENIITSIGSLSRIDSDLLKQEYKKFADKLDKIKSPKIALLIGGSSKKGQFNAKIAGNLTNIIVNIVKNMNANLLVTTSRRTNKDVVRQLKNDLKSSDFFFEWQENKPNPYFAFLQSADYIIVTGDSMSMCSESCSTGKSVYIYNPWEICSKKHLRFHQNLFINNYAKQLDINVGKLEADFADKLDETSRIAVEINDFLVSKNL